jgi:hypothetical protein
LVTPRGSVFARENAHNVLETDHVEQFNNEMVYVMEFDDFADAAEWRQSSQQAASRIEIDTLQLRAIDVRRIVFIRISSDSND